MVQQGHNLVLPGSTGGYTSLPGSWSSYSARNREYLMAKMQSMEALRPNDEPLTIDYIWDGDGDNKNSALTVFRHGDSASVVQGFVGEPPKTAWLINYPLLERIHYMVSGIELLTDKPQLELYDVLQKHLSATLERKYDIDNMQVPVSHRDFLRYIEKLNGKQVQHLPEVAVLSIDDTNGQSYLYSILRNREHSNITGLFSEDDTHLPEEDNLTVVRGIIGDYPSVFWRVDSSALEHFASSIAGLEDTSDYADFMTGFGVRRSHVDFWAHSDKVLSIYAEMEPVDGGLLDYNRLENR